jgi:thioredoxin-dependent peroxiredoxin
MGFSKTILGIAVGMFGLACSTASGAKRKTMLTIGEPAPDLKGKNSEGHVATLSEIKGQQAVVYYYPKDETPGCTKEACAFRDAFDKFKNANIKIFGVSHDSEASHQKFLKNHKLPFFLVADESGTIQDAYGVSNNMFGMASRVTFLIGPDGKVQFVWPNVNPGVHADEVLAKAKELSGKH